MINLLSSNLIALPDLPSFSRGGSRRRVAVPDRRRASEQQCPQEMKRWIGRWENEGGATRQQNTESEITPARNSRMRSAPHDCAADKIMKQTQQHEEMIRYGDPLMSSSRRRSGGYPVMTYNDRSPEVAAMNAYLRASNYPERADEKRSNETPRLTSGDGLVQKRMRSSLHLGSQYDTQSRDNFIREAVFFVLIVAASVWPIVHSVQALAAMW